MQILNTGVKRILLRHKMKHQRLVLKKIQNLVEHRHGDK